MYLLTSCLSTVNYLPNSKLECLSPPSSSSQRGKRTSIGFAQVEITLAGLLSFGVLVGFFGWFF